MMKREIPWIPIGVAGGVIVLAVLALLLLQPKPAVTPAGSVVIEGVEGGLGQLDTAGAGGVDGPPSGTVDGPQAGAIDGPPSLDVESWQELFQGEIQ